MRFLKYGYYQRGMGMKSGYLEIKISKLKLRMVDGEEQNINDQYKRTHARNKKVNEKDLSST